MGITPQQFDQIQSRLARPKRAPVPVFDSSPQAETQIEMNQVVLGIDPSLRGTGYGVVQKGKPRSTSLAFGTIKCPPRWERSRCLVKIAQTLRDVMREHHPTMCAIESLFFAQNLQTALIMGEARGAILATVAEAGLQIFEVAPRKMKQAIVGYGAAQKHAVGKMVQRMLDLPEVPDPDAADALALALTFIQEQNRFSLSNPRKV